MPYASRQVLIRYGVACWTAGLALGAGKLLAPWSNSPVSLFLAAVMISAWCGGLGPGLLTTLLSALALDLFFLPSFYSSPQAALSDSVRLGVFVLTAVLISSLNAARQRYQQQLERQDQRKDAFLSLVAHELRNPLSPLLHALRILQMRPQDRPTVERTRDLMERQVHQLARLIEDLLDLSRINQGRIQLHKQRVEVGPAMNAAAETVRPVIEARRHHLEVCLPSAPLHVDADPARLEQILVNLLTNAARYTPPGGQIWLGAARQHGAVELWVRDTGDGIDPALLPHIFDLFVQGDNGSPAGLGLGLNLVRQLVELHDGSVTASSRGPHHGSEFTIRLPALEPTAEDSTVLDVRIEQH